MSGEETPLVFISYEWSKQKEIELLYRRLKKLNFSCWMDVHQIKGGDSLLEKIDQGVRGCKIVICGVTKKYAMSQNCRMELKLAHVIGKPIVPLLLEDMEWPPEGPMSLIFSDMLYIDCWSDRALQKQWVGQKFDILERKLCTYIPAEKKEAVEGGCKINSDSNVIDTGESGEGSGTERSANVQCTILNNRCSENNSTSATSKCEKQPAKKIKKENNTDDDTIEKTAKINVKETRGLDADRGNKPVAKPKEKKKKIADLKGACKARENFINESEQDEKKQIMKQDGVTIRNETGWDLGEGIGRNYEMNPDAVGRGKKVSQKVGTGNRDVDVICETGKDGDKSVEKEKGQNFPERKNKIKESKATHVLDSVSQEIDITENYFSEDSRSFHFDKPSKTTERHNTACVSGEKHNLPRYKEDNREVEKVIQVSTAQENGVGDSSNSKETNNLQKKANVVDRSKPTESRSAGTMTKGVQLDTNEYQGETTYSKNGSELCASMGEGTEKKHTKRKTNKMQNNRDGAEKYEGEDTYSTNIEISENYFSEECVCSKQTKADRSADCNATTCTVQARIRDIEKTVVDEQRKPMKPKSKSTGKGKTKKGSETAKNLSESIHAPTEMENSCVMKGAGAKGQDCKRDGNSDKQTNGSNGRADEVTNNDVKSKTIPKVKKKASASETKNKTEKNSTKKYGAEECTKHGVEEALAKELNSDTNTQQGLMNLRSNKDDNKKEKRTKAKKSTSETTSKHKDRITKDLNDDLKPVARVNTDTGEDTQNKTKEDKYTWKEPIRNESNNTCHTSDGTNVTVKAMVMTDNRVDTLTNTNNAEKSEHTENHEWDCNVTTNDSEEGTKSHTQTDGRCKKKNRRGSGENDATKTSCNGNTRDLNRNHDGSRKDDNTEKRKTKDKKKKIEANSPNKIAEEVGSMVNDKTSDNAIQGVDIGGRAAVAAESKGVK